IAPFVHLIHGVDSLSLLQEINKQARKNSREIKCLMQMFIAEEETEFGFSEEEVLHLLNNPAFLSLDHIKIIGLMGMATFTEDKSQVRNEFKKLNIFFEQLKALNLPRQVEMKELSMGMSNDYTIAVEEGSIMVRIGTAIFGERKYDL